MAVTATVELTGTVQGDPAGSRSDNATWTSGASLRAVTEFAATSSFAQATIPTGATAVLITMPTGNTNNVTIAGANSDTGVNIGPTGPAFVPIAGGNLWIKAAANTTVQLSWY